MLFPCPESDHLSSYSHSIPTFFIVVVYRHLGLSNLLFDMGIIGVGVPAGRLPLSPIHDKCGDDKKIPSVRRACHGDGLRLSRLN